MKCYIFVHFNLRWGFKVVGLRNGDPMIPGCRSLTVATPSLQIPKVTVIASASSIIAAFRRLLLRVMVP